MHPIATDHASEAALPHAGENLLVIKTTGQQHAAAPTGSLLLTSVPFGWRGIIVEQHRLPPMELAEHSVIGHGISVNVGTQPGIFAWTRGRDGWKDRPTNPGHCRILTHGESHPSRWFQTYNEVSLILDPRFLADVVEDGLPADRIAFVTRDSVTDAAIAIYAETFRAERLAVRRDTHRRPGAAFARQLRGRETESTGPPWQADVISASQRGGFRPLTARHRCLADCPRRVCAHQSLSLCAALPGDAWSAAASVRLAAPPATSDQAHHRRTADACANRHAASTISHTSRARFKEYSA